MGEIIFDDEIPFGDEIRLDGGWVDLISSAQQISSECNEDFIAPRAISLENLQAPHIIAAGVLQLCRCFTWAKPKLYYILSGTILHSIQKFIVL